MSDMGKDNSTAMGLKVYIYIISNQGMHQLLIYCILKSV